jgi:hypothetical protein
VKISLSFHSYHPLSELEELGGYALKLGFSRIWLDDPPSEIDTVSVAQTLFESFGKSVAIGALNAQKWLSKADWLKKLNREMTIALAPGKKTRSFKELFDTLMKLYTTTKALGFETLLACQGPRLLAKSALFDGVLLNFLNVDAVKWAQSVSTNKRVLCTAPSLIYDEAGYTASDRQKLINGARLVRNEASSFVKNRFCGIEHYAVFCDVKSASKMLKTLRIMGVEEVVLAYPQSRSKKLIRAASRLLR